jgi:hypothetical protein
MKKDVEEIYKRSKQKRQVFRPKEKLDQNQVMHIIQRPFSIEEAKQVNEYFTLNPNGTFELNKTMMSKGFAFPRRGEKEFNDLVARYNSEHSRGIPNLNKPVYVVQEPEKEPVIEQPSFGGIINPIATFRTFSNEAGKFIQGVVPINSIRQTSEEAMKVGRKVMNVVGNSLQNTIQTGKDVIDLLSDVRNPEDYELPKKTKNKSSSSGFP